MASATTTGDSFLTGAGSASGCASLSPSPARMAASSSAMAVSSSTPSAWTVISLPQMAPNVSTETIDFALAFFAPCRRLIVDLNCLARVTSTLAGRACSPVWFWMTSSTCFIADSVILHGQAPMRKSGFRKVVFRPDISRPHPGQWFSGARQGLPRHRSLRRGWRALLRVHLPKRRCRSP